YNQWDVSANYAQQKSVPREAALPIYFCPSRRTSSSAPYVSQSGDGNSPGALGDYAASIGTTGMDFP
ncbi:hypothetical protein NL529_28800, partial [Klebsiella pneumoniae]|nr:hypothetical protein [Klebsiella pneumoniae]